MILKHNVTFVRLNFKDLFFASALRAAVHELVIHIGELSPLWMMMALELVLKHAQHGTLLTLKPQQSSWPSSLDVATKDLLAPIIRSLDHLRVIPIHLVNIDELALPTLYDRPLHARAEVVFGKIAFHELAGILWVMFPLLKDNRSFSGSGTPNLILPRSRVPSSYVWHPGLICDACFKGVWRGCLGNVQRFFG